MKKNRLVCAALAVLTSVSALSACNSGNAAETEQAGQTEQTQQTEQTTETAQEQTSADTQAQDTQGGILANWAGIDKNTVVARLKDSVQIDDRDSFDITFGEFFSEYLFYLTAYGISEDLSGESADICKQYRQQIMDYLTLERNTLYAADKEYGINEASFTDEQRAKIEEDAKTARQNRIDSYYNAALASLGENATEEQIQSECLRLFLEEMELCGLDDDIFKKWETSELIQQLVINEITKDIAVTDEELEQFYLDAVKDAKAIYEEDPTAFEQNSSYGAVYMPEGTRAARHIYVAFSSEDIEKINASTDAAEQEALMEQAYTDEIKAQVEEIQAEIAAGADFAELQGKYGDKRESYYYVTPASVTFPEKLSQVFFALDKVGDVSEPVLFNNGVYIFKFDEEPVISDEDVALVKNQMREFLVEYKKSEAQNTAFTQWMERYPYDIDTELLRLDGDTSGSAANTSETGE